MIGWREGWTPSYRLEHPKRKVNITSTWVRLRFELQNDDFNWNIVFIRKTNFTLNAETKFWESWIYFFPTNNAPACHLSAELRASFPCLCQLKTGDSISIITCEVSGGGDAGSLHRFGGGERQGATGFFIMTDRRLSRFHLLLKVVDKCPECAKRLCHQDVFLKKCFWHLTSWQSVSVSFSPAARQGDRLWFSFSASSQAARLTW